MRTNKKPVIDRYIATSDIEAAAILSGTKTQIIIPVHSFGRWKIGHEWPSLLSYCREKTPEGWYFWGDMQRGPNPWDVDQWYEQIPAPQVGESIFLAEYHRRANQHEDDGIVYSSCGLGFGLGSETRNIPFALLPSAADAEAHAQSMPRGSRWRKPLAMPRVLSCFVASITAVSAQRVQDCDVRSMEWMTKIVNLGLVYKRPFRYGDNPWCWVLDIRREVLG